MATTQADRIMQLTTPLAPDYLLINTLSAEEGLSKLFEVQMELLHEENEEGFEPTIVAANDLLGKVAVVKIIQPDETSRYFHGICNRFSQGSRNGRFTFYNITVVPQVWILTQHIQSRIFQHKTVKQILAEVFDGFDVKDETTTDFKPRNYCVQFQESNFDFASRLMEEEGIFYFFEHTDSAHRMILADKPESHRECPVKSEIPYHLNIDPEKFEASIHKWASDYRLQTGRMTIWDHSFQLPKNKLDAGQPSRFNIGGNQELEKYEFHGGYSRKYDGIDRTGGERSDLDNVFPDRERTAEIRMQALDAKHHVISGTGDCSSMTAGHRFKLTYYPVSNMDGNYVITSVRHQGLQNPDYISGESPSQPYLNEFECIPHPAPPFRPLQVTRKPIMRGAQTAVVVGPPGEEIFTDKYGRVKVQFHWDRYGRNDADSSCWLRVLKDSAGAKWGTFYLPRIGQEVIVDFMEGDPDQPIISGCMYNAESMPHYDLPKYKTLTYIKTHSTPGGKGYNELRFEDNAKKEQVFLYSQKRMDFRARGSHYETCGGNRQEVIGLRYDNEPGGNLAITVGGNYDLHVKGDQYIGIDKKLFEGVKSDVAEEYGGQLQTVVTSKVELNAREITLEALTKISLRVGATCVVLDLSGVTIQGPIVKINSGGAAAPTGPMLMGDPLDAEHADTGEPGYCDRPRRGGGGGGRRWRTVNGQHAPIVTDQAFALTRTGGHGDDLDRALVAAELSKLPPHILQRMEDNGTTVVVGRGSVTDLRPDLAGQTPRDWPAGTSWDTVPGLYDPDNNEVLITTRGHGTEGGPYVPPTGDGHGSSNLVIHESMHGVDHGSGDISGNDQAFNDARDADQGTLDNYEGNANPDGDEETYAESAARHYGGDPNDAANHPNLHNYWDGDPLNPNPAPAAP